MDTTRSGTGGRVRSRRGMRRAACAWCAAVVLCVGCGSPSAKSAKRPEGTTAGTSAAAASREAPAKPLDQSLDAAHAAAATASTAKPEMRPSKPLTGAELYAQHCAGCHGVAGDGKGIAATFLFPKPRDIRAGRFRLVSTTNGVPSAEDLDAVLKRGMPGSSMPPWPALTDAERKLLVGEVQRLHADGMREQYIAQLKQETGEEQPEIDEKELAAFVASKTTAGAASDVPPIGQADAQAVARGKALYVRQSCHSCHGNEGKGDGQQVMVDAEGLATRPRDLTRGIYKGPHDAASIYRRIALGMPGTPMPASPNLKPEEIVDMVHFLLSLSTEQQRQAAVLRRDRLTATRLPAVPRDERDAAWNAVQSVAVSTTPLWWRDDADPQLTVQAVHDGQTLALRLVWRDATRNDAAIGPDQFEDLAAVQLYAGNSEPFLGMGAAPATIDLWQWRGGLYHDGKELELMDEYPFDTPLYRELAKGKPLPDFITARAGGNPLATRQHSGSNLTAKGPGSVTFRPVPSQLVQASGEWNAGQWTVMLRRPMAVPPDAGPTVAVGQRYSAAFAVWDGAAHDRAAQKVISLWQDLYLSP